MRQYRVFPAIRLLSFHRHIPHFFLFGSYSFLVYDAASFVEKIKLLFPDFLDMSIFLTCFNLFGDFLMQIIFFLEIIFIFVFTFVAS